MDPVALTAGPSVPAELSLSAERILLLCVYQGEAASNTSIDLVISMADQRDIRTLIMTRATRQEHTLILGDGGLPSLIRPIVAPHQAVVVLHPHATRSDRIQGVKFMIAT